jgi:hypothetical protein
MGKDSDIIFLEILIMKDIDIIQVVTLEEFIKEQIQETAESVFE